MPTPSFARNIVPILQDEGWGDGEGVRCVQGWLLIRDDGGSCFQGKCTGLRAECDTSTSKVQGLGRKVRERRSSVSRSWVIRRSRGSSKPPPKPSSQVTPVMFLLRCSSGHGRHLLTHVWVGVPMSYTTGLPRRNEDGGLPNGGWGTIRCPRPSHQKLLFGLRKILGILYTALWHHSSANCTLRKPSPP